MQYVSIVFEIIANPVKCFFTSLLSNKLIGRRSPLERDNIDVRWVQEVRRRHRGAKCSPVGQAFILFSSGDKCGWGSLPFSSRFYQISLRVKQISTSFTTKYTFYYEEYVLSFWILLRPIIYTYTYMLIHVCNMNVKWKKNIGNIVPSEITVN